MAVAGRLSKSQKENVESKLFSATTAIKTAYYLSDLQKKHPFDNSLSLGHFEMYAKKLVNERIPKASNGTLENRLWSVRGFCCGNKSYVTSIRKDEYDVVCSILDDLSRYAANGNIGAHGDAVALVIDINAKKNASLGDFLLSEINGISISSASVIGILRGLVIAGSKDYVYIADRDLPWRDEIISLSQAEVSELKYGISKLRSCMTAVERERYRADREDEINHDMRICPSCSAAVSKAAFTCPKCGHPLKYGATKESFGCLGIILIFAIIAFLLIGLISMGR
jgi:ribosomal protein S27AE